MGEFDFVFFFCDIMAFCVLNEFSLGFGASYVLYGQVTIPLAAWIWFSWKRVAYIFAFSAVQLIATLINKHNQSYFTIMQICIFLHEYARPWKIPLYCISTLA
jgi:hypothetical protein